MCGINDNHIQRCLLQEADLTYKKSLKIAQAMEVAAHDVNDLQKQLPTTATVQHLQVQKLAILQRFVTVNQRRYQKRLQKVKPHIL